jgi:hypothetical protein
LILIPARPIEYRDILTGVDPQIQRFDSLAEADEAEVNYYASLTPAQRLDILFELIATYQENSGEDSQGLERVYRVVELERG